MDRERRGIGGGSQWLAARHNDGRTSASTFSTCTVSARPGGFSTCSIWRSHCRARRRTASRKGATIFRFSVFDRSLSFFSFFFSPLLSFVLSTFVNSECLFRPPVSLLPFCAGLFRTYCTCAGATRSCRERGFPSGDQTRAIIRRDDELGRADRMSRMLC